MNLKNNATIAELRKAGWKIRVLHRYLDQTVAEIEHHVNGPLNDTWATPVSTQIDVTSPNGDNATGFAFLSPKDNWNRKIGNRIALNRALGNLFKDRINRAMELCY